MPGAGRARLKAYLRDHGVSFDVVEHARTESAAAEARAALLPAEQTAKTVVLNTPGGYRFEVICASDRLDLHKTADALMVNRHELRLASEADMAEDFPAYDVGAIPPVGPDTPAELIDVHLLDYGQVMCPAGDHEHSLLVDPAESVLRGRGLWICARTSPRLRARWRPADTGRTRFAAGGRTLFTQEPPKAGLRVATRPNAGSGLAIGDEQVSRDR